MATALAKYDFPVPGGPYKRNALHGLLFPTEIMKQDEKKLIIIEKFVTLLSNKISHRRNDAEAQKAVSSYKELK